MGGRGEGEQQSVDDRGGSEAEVKQKLKWIKRPNHKRWRTATTYSVAKIQEEPMMDERGRGKVATVKSVPSYSPMKRTERSTVRFWVFFLFCLIARLSQPSLLAHIACSGCSRSKQDKTIYTLSSQTVPVNRSLR